MSTRNCTVFWSESFFCWSMVAFVVKIPLFSWLGRRRSIGALLRRGATHLQTSGCGASAVPFGGVSGARIHSPHGGLPGSPCLFGLVPDTIAFWQKPDLGPYVLRVARFVEYLRKNEKQWTWRLHAMVSSMRRQEVAWCCCCCCFHQLLLPHQQALRQANVAGNPV